MATNTTATFGSAIGKFISAKLIELADQQHKFPQFCNDITLEGGNGKTAYFYLYDRIAIPMAPLAEGVTPDETAMTNSEQTITIDEWGMYVTIATLAGLTIHHPVFNIATERIADAIARVDDFTIAEVILASTNKQYWDGTRANRGAITATDVFKKEVFLQAKVTMDVAGASTREGDAYAFLTDPNVAIDIINESANNHSATLLHAQAGDIAPLEKGFVKEHLGFHVVKTNFIPVYKRRASDVTITKEAGGSLAAVQHFIKVVRRSVLDGFSDEISTEDSSTVNPATLNDRIKVVAPATANMAYDIYLGVVTGDANLFLAVQGLQASGTAYITVAPTSGVTAPATPASSVNVHVGVCFGKYSTDCVKLSGARVTGLMTPKGASDSDPLDQRRKMGSKFAQKAGIRNTRDTLVIELASTFS